MCNKFEYDYADRVVARRWECFGITCLAIIGAANIMKCIADSAYRRGRDTKEVEMKREFKKQMKLLKKRGL